MNISSCFPNTLQYSRVGSIRVIDSKSLRSATAGSTGPLVWSMIYSIAGRKGHSGREPANRSGCSRIDYFTVSMHSPAVRAARGDNEWKCRSCDLIMHWKWPIIQCRWGVLHLYLNQRIIQSTLGGDVSHSTHSPTATRLRLCSSLCYRWKFLLAYLIRCYMARSNKVGNNSLRPEWDEVNDAIKPNSSTMSFILCYDDL